MFLVKRVNAKATVPSLSPLLNWKISLSLSHCAEAKDPPMERNVEDYQESIRALNRLQSNKVAYERAVNEKRRTGGLGNVAEYLRRAGVHVNEFEAAVPVIHVSGTKGKGSTCALCESILRAHGFKTGLFTSPHLMTVKERIRINGAPLTDAKFGRYFWDVHDRLENDRDHEDDMPTYFSFLTIMAFKVFLEEKVDVAVVEVGIGGERDCTNILRKTPVVGITSLGYDHTRLLGETIEEIAWQKGGILKEGCVGYTVPTHPPSALEVLRTRAQQAKATLHIVPDFSEYNLNPSDFNITCRLNASLALQLANAWMNIKNNIIPDNNPRQLSSQTLSGITSCEWLGRFQIIQRGRHTLYLDGAHTRESVQLCSEWFNQTTTKATKRVLIFNCIKGRDPEGLLKYLAPCNFDTAIFTTNDLTTDHCHSPLDLISVARDSDSDRDRNLRMQTIWKTLSPHSITYVKESVSNSHSFIECSEESCHVLVTGSLHLVGTYLTLLQN